MLLCILLMIAAGCQAKDENIKEKIDNQEEVEKEEPKEILLEVPNITLQFGSSQLEVQPITPTKASEGSFQLSGTFINEDERPTVKIAEDEVLKVDTTLKNLQYEVYNQDLEKQVEGTMDGTIKLMETEDTYLYHITGILEGEENIQEEIDYQFFVERNLTPKVSSNTNEVIRGDLFTISVSYLNPDESIALKAPFTTYPVKFFPMDEKQIANVTIPSSWDPGTLELEIQISKDGDIVNVLPLTIEVIDKEYEADYLYVDETLTEMRTDDAYDIMQQHIDEARSNPSNDLFIDGNFIQPIEGTITTEYGQLRYVNDQVDSIHNGIDIAAPTGTEIKADQNGKIVLAMELPVLGNTILIDHGQNIYSAFYHMSGLNVEKDQRVSIGDTIGFVGTTGFSTGPHLHWCIWVNGTFTNPWQLIESFPLETQKIIEGE